MCRLSKLKLDIQIFQFHKLWKLLHREIGLLGQPVMGSSVFPAREQTIATEEIIRIFD